MSELSERFGGNLTRRKFLKDSALGAVSGFFIGATYSSLAADAAISGAGSVTMPFGNGARKMAKFPQKRPLIVMTSRPPQLETPFEVFNESILTPNDAFFVRYHLSGIPTSVDPEAFRVSVKGKVNTPAEFSLTDLRNNFDAVEFIAVNQCSGNGRGYSKPRVGGGQSGNGTMGNAKWKGARLKDVLNKAGVAANAKDVTFNGLDKGVTDKTPDFVKALDIEHALEEDVLLAYEMNDEPLPMLNGFPLRLVVPGYFGTYWVKHVNEITVLDEQFKGFWMDPAYRVPDNTCACIEPGTTMKKSRPISRYVVRSFITSLKDGSSMKANQPVTVRGIAFDGGYGITEVLFSQDGGKSWREAQLGKDMGKYSFREWTIPFTPRKAGAFDLMVKASNRIGQTQPAEALWNPSGYMRNVIETTSINVTA
jgi:DMSO/TMAO reductase YedYZ molybdopterin-dependent catalytic subunit